MCWIPGWVVLYASKGENRFKGASSVASHQLDRHHLTVPHLGAYQLRPQAANYLDVAESLVKVVHSETDKGVGHLLALWLWVHSPMGRWSPNFLSAPPQHLHPEIIITCLTTESYFILCEHGAKCYLEISWWGPAADGEGDLVVEEVDDQVQVDRLLPIHIGVANW